MRIRHRHLGRKTGLAGPGIAPTRLVLLLHLLMAAVLAAAPGAAEQFTEYEVKAAFVVNFTKFVSWPDEALPDEVFRICIAGENPFREAFDPFRDDHVGKRVLHVVEVASLDRIEECQVLYVAPSEGPRLKQILRRTRSRPILTVSDAEAFAEGGGIIGLYSVGNKIRFKINLGAANRAGLQISAKLLGLAELVETDPRGNAGSGFLTVTARTTAPMEGSE